MKSLHPTLGKPIGAKNAVSIQKSFRTSDIDRVGDETHLTFFEMLGNFSFGGYGKKEAIEYARDFLKEVGLEIEHVTVFGGDSKTPADIESEKIWKKLLPEEKIKKAGREDNFWGPTGKEGPCGPTTEIYIGGIEIWNIVFNEYYCAPDGTMKKLAQLGVDTGMGLERLAMVLQKKKNIFETDLFRFASLLKGGDEDVSRSVRIIADHLRGSIFLLADGIRPSNKEAGYVLRRLMRRLFVYEYQANIVWSVVEGILHDMIHEYGEMYHELFSNSSFISGELLTEREKFLKTLEAGVEFLKKMDEIDSHSAFKLYETYGIPFEIIKEFGAERAQKLDRAEFDEEFRKHQEISRAGIEKKFGGHGMILDTGELKAADEEELKKVTRLHTATHLLQAALRKILGDTVRQAGSDITAERARFDFSFERKLSDEERKKVEDTVNWAISSKFDVQMKEMPYEEAIKAGSLHFFKEKYPATVKVYSVGHFKADPPEIFSRELCGGPHVKNTSEIGHFKIIKQEAIGAGLRRIRATVE